MNFHPWTSAYKRAVKKLGLAGAAMIYGEPEQRPRFIHDIEALELLYGPPEDVLGYEDFRPYQKWMAQLIVEQDCLLGAEMGLGKTAAALWAAVQLIEAGEVKGVLIIAPLKVAEDTWPAEIAKWAFARHLTYRIITGTPDEKAAAMDRDAVITITNRENVKWLKQRTSVRRWQFDMLIYDEASRLKSGRKRSKPNVRKDGSVGERNLTEFGILRQMRFRFKRIVELSGTPSPNGLIDLWGPIYLLDQGKRLKTSMTAYKREWFYPEDPYSGSTKNEPFPHSEKQIMDAVKDIFFALREKDYLKLPPLMVVDHKIKLSPAEMAKYRKFEIDAAMAVRNAAGDPDMIEAVNKGVLTGKLLQFANGSLYENVRFEEGTDKKLPREATTIHTLKLDALDSIYRESMNPILVAYSFKFDKEAILKRFPACRVYGDGKNDKRDWNAGKIPMLLIHPASAGHGLNLQHGSNIAVWYGLTWSCELYWQFIKRLHRPGQKHDHVMLHHIIARGTADESILPVLANRKSTEDRLKNAVKARLERVLYDQHKQAA